MKEYPELGVYDPDWTEHDLVATMQLLHDRYGLVLLEGTDGIRHLAFDVHILRDPFAQLD
jgi:hypothetical protein